MALHLFGMQKLWIPCTQGGLASGALLCTLEVAGSSPVNLDLVMLYLDIRIVGDRVQTGGRAFSIVRYVLTKSKLDSDQLVWGEREMRVGPRVSKLGMIRRLCHEGYLSLTLNGHQCTEMGSYMR